MLGSAALVGLSPDLIWLNIAAQALNAFLLPPLVGLLIALATRALAVRAEAASASPVELGRPRAADQ